MENTKAIRAAVEELQKISAQIFELVNALEENVKTKSEEIRRVENNVQVTLVRILQTLANSDEEYKQAITKLALDYVPPPVPQAFQMPDEAHGPVIEQLKTLLHSNEWPVAVNEFLICDLKSEGDKDERAQGIIASMLDSDLSGKRFLDFGCGEGHVVNEIAPSVSLAVGYDIVQSNNGRFTWEEQNKTLLTTDFDKVRANGPYDVILVYDVLDHVKDPVAVLSLAAEVLAPKGVMKIRFHPWCSRHGGNIYRQINKAFVHLVFTEEELEILGYEPKTVQKVIYPIITYRKWIQSAKLQVKDEFPERNTVEEFFKNNALISKRIRQNWNELNFPIVQTEQSFVEYTVTR